MKCGCDSDGVINFILTEESCWSRVAYSVDDVEGFFKETVENRYVVFFHPSTMM